MSSAWYFVNSSLAPVLLLRQRVKSSAPVLEFIRQHVFSQSRWDALHGYWGALCRQGPCGPVHSLEPWVRWIPPDLHGVYKWVLDVLVLLRYFARHVSLVRRDSGLRRWANWLREDLGSRPYAWLRPDCVPPSPFLVIREKVAKTSQILA